MKRILVVCVLAGLMLFGCIGASTTDSKQQDNNQTQMDARDTAELPGWSSYGIIERTATLKNGTRITCLFASGGSYGGGLSCDWEHTR